jgi:hypothetical protein
VESSPSTDSYPVYKHYAPQFFRDPASLTAEICQLWEAHRRFDGEIETETIQQRAVENSLGQLLFETKRQLASPGRNGRWSRFLRDYKINRAMADRLVARYARAHNLILKLPMDALFEPTEVEITILFLGLWPKLERTLTTPRARFEFLRCLVDRASMPHSWCDRGIVIDDPSYIPTKMSEVVISEQEGIISAGRYGDVL